MADPKDTTSFFRKVVKFVANPSTDWADIGGAPSEPRETEFAKSELKAMIERKRRNDFVRKREFDMLRKVRREGLTGDQLAALGSSSRIDDSEAKLQEIAAKPDGGVKAKIDAIEKQMVGGGEVYPGPRRGNDFYNAPTQPATLPGRSTEEGALGRNSRRGDLGAPATPEPAPAAAVMSPGMSPLSPLPLDVSAAVDLSHPFASVEVNEVAHDPDLDEAVIAFANADFELCEQSLSALTGPSGPRAGHAETWLVRFDLYRAIGQQHKFESLALDYAQQFGWSAPQWFSMPKLVAESAGDAAPAAAHVEGQIGWVAPEYLDSEAVAKLRSQTLQMPLPWVFDWSKLNSVDPEAASRLSELFRGWIPQKLEMRWLGGDRLFQVLQDAAPTGARDADPAFWQLRLDALRMCNRPDQFDEAAIDYCVTYEVSPPSWEPAVCSVRVSGSEQDTRSPSLSVVSDASTTFVESSVSEESSLVEVTTLELAGQLVGDIAPTLERMNEQLGGASMVNVACAKLIRVDFIAAGDLLNWVLARRAESRTVSFTEAHRLVALFFGAMGITEHAKVKVRTV